MSNSTDSNAGSKSSSTMIELVFAWLWVGIPLAWGVFETLRQASALFK